LISSRFPGAIPNGSLSLYTQILISSFGYTSQEALALSAPAGVVSVVTVLITGRLSDRWNSRTLVVFIGLIPTIIGGVLLVRLAPASFLVSPSRLHVESG
jgi:ACS family allantoate permease-like MFS transporter